MRCVGWLVFAMLCCMAYAVAAPVGAPVEITVTRQILLPDGSPAVGATVTVRTFEGDMLLQELALKTDAHGIFSAPVKYVRSASSHTPHGYLLVELPHYALAFGRLTVKSNHENGEAFADADTAKVIGPLSLSPAYQRKGLVVDDATGQPVPRATVAVFAVNFSPTNRISRDIYTESLVTETDAAGRFLLRGFTVEEPAGYASPPGGTTATLFTGVKIGNRSLGAVARYKFPESAFEADAPIRLKPLTWVEGRVIHATTNQPVAGMLIKLDQFEQSLSAIAVSITDSNGRYCLPTMLPLGRAMLKLSQNHFFPAAVPVPRPRQDPGLVARIPVPDIVAQPCVTVSGTIIDAVTGNIPLSDIHLSLDAETRQKLHQRMVSLPSSYMSPDGRFSFDMPVGGGTISLRGSGYQGTAVLAADTLAASQTITVTRVPGFLIRSACEHDGPVIGAAYQLWYKKADGTEAALPNTFRQKQFTCFIEERLVQSEQTAITIKQGEITVIPWTPIRKDVWPNEIEIPQQ